MSACFIAPSEARFDGNFIERSFEMPAVNDSLTVRIYSPPGHSADADEQIPVAYVLGNADFEVAAAYAASSSQPLMVVGLGYGRKEGRRPACFTDEYRDYTPQPVSEEAKKCASGLADGFYLFLRDNLMPELESEYGGDPHRRTLIGHELGGLFVMHIGLAHGRDAAFPFAMLIAGDAELNFDEGAILRRELRLYEDNPNDRRLPIALKAMYGSLSDPARLAYFTELDARMTFHAYAEFDYESQIIDDADRYDMRFETLERGVAVASGL